MKITQLWELSKEELINIIKENEKDIRELRQRMKRIQFISLSNLKPTKIKLNK